MKAHKHNWRCLIRPLLTLTFVEFAIVAWGLGLDRRIVSTALFAFSAGLIVRQAADRRTPAEQVNMRVNQPVPHPYRNTAATVDNNVKARPIRCRLGLHVWALIVAWGGGWRLYRCTRPGCGEECEDFDH